LEPPNFEQCKGIFPLSLSPSAIGFLHADFPQVFKFDASDRKWKEETLPPQKVHASDVDFAAVFHPFTNIASQATADVKSAVLEGQIHDIAWAPQTGVFCSIEY
jgi:hypothetical protein